MDKSFAVYILASERNGTLYVGVTSNLVQRAWQHKEGFVGGFTKEFDVKLLVWFEQHETAESAITREKQIEKWNRGMEGQIDRGEQPRIGMIFTPQSLAD